MKIINHENWKVILGAAVAGFAMTAVFVAYQVVTDTYPKPPEPNMLAILLFVILCPPSLLSVPIIDAEIGTSGFYFVFLIVALLNAALYGAVAALVLRLRKKFVQ
jgi:hypothetical protein